MEIKQLEAFVAVAERLNISHAAERLYITQPTLSKHIAELEQNLCTKLFTRNNRGVILTEEGAALLPTVKDILKNIDELPNTVRHTSQSAAYKENIVIGIDRKLMRNLLFKSLVSHAIDLLHCHFPAVNVYFEPHDNNELLNLLRHDDIDAGIMMQYGFSDFKGQDCSVFFQDTVGMLISKNKLASFGNPDPREILPRIDILQLSENPNEQIPVFQVFSHLDATPSIKYVGDDNMAYMYLCLGDGVFIVPSLIARDYRDDNLTFVELPDLSETINYTISWKNENQNRFIRILFELLSEQFARLK